MSMSEGGRASQICAAEDQAAKGSASAATSVICCSGRIDSL